MKQLSMAALLLAFCFTAIPSCAAFVYGAAASFGYFSPNGTNALTLRYYAAVFQNGDVWASLGFSLWVLFASLLLSFLIAFLLALALSGTDRISRVSRSILRIPLPTPHLAVAAAFLLLLSQSGLFARIFFALGVIEEPAQFPKLIYDPWGIGFIAVLLWKEVPFLLVVMLSLFESQGNRYRLLATSLGATQWQRIRYVDFPYIVRGTFSSLIIIALFMIGTYEISLMLAQTYPPTLAVLTYQRYSAISIDSKAEAFALSTLIFALISIPILLLYRASLGASFGEFGEEKQ